MSVRIVLGIGVVLLAGMIFGAGFLVGARYEHQHLKEQGELNRAAGVD